MEKKASDKIQHSVIIKAPNKLGVEGNVFNIIEDIYEKLTANTT